MPTNDPKNSNAHMELVKVDTFSHKLSTFANPQFFAG
jgi:hypothetical protein